MNGMTMDQKELLAPGKGVFATFEEDFEKHPITGEFSPVHRMFINLPGGTDVVCHVITEDFWEEHPEKEEFLPRYQRWLTRKENTIDGFPLGEWPGIGKHQLLALNSLNIFSLEQLAESSDATVQKIGMGGNQLRQNAKDYLAHMKGVAVLQQAAQEKENLKQSLESANEQIALLKEEIAALKVSSRTTRAPRGKQTEEEE